MTIGRTLPAPGNQADKLVAAIRLDAQRRRGGAIRTRDLSYLTGIRAGAIFTILERDIKAGRVLATPITFPGRRREHEYRPGSTASRQPGSMPAAQPAVARNAGSVSSMTPPQKILEGHTVATQPPTPTPTRRRQGNRRATALASAGDVHSPA